MNLVPAVCDGKCVLPHDPALAAAAGVQPELLQRVAVAVLGAAGRQPVVEGRPQREQHSARSYCASSEPLGWDC